jgi:hypothetical protein
LELDLDGEGLSVVACGSKNAIPFFVRFCMVLGIEFPVMHDQHVYESSHPLAQKNAEQERTNSTISTAMRGRGHPFLLQPTLEESLGVGRQASNKSRRVLETVRAMPPELIPEPIISAVKQLAGLPPF